MAYTLDSAPLTLDDLVPLADHAVRHALESGQHGDVIFMPYGAGDLPTRRRVMDHFETAWQRRLDQPGWCRTWVLKSDGRMVGHADLTGGGLRAALHRCSLGMGLEREARGAGWGGRLLDVSIAWAQAQPSLFWLDLAVFQHNAAARHLYESRGFVVTGAVDDRFRVDGQQIYDVQMTLAVG